ncbi:MAG TPA: pyridoxamine 5'-phosphate oxidase family protein [Polyangiaceae bacterium]|jgi:hypothetical protein|nr:pyridoxamine 5'-phosphate oxidase family protein [Polyangiaceae bacterium]
MDSRASFAKTPNTQVRRRPDRASYDRETAYAILDEALYASVGFVAQGGPCVIPMAFARLGDRLVLHGASTSRLQSVLGSEAAVCVGVTLVDGIVLSRSAMHHSLNYRSVVVFGHAVELATEAEKQEALAAIVDHVLPGRSAETRPPNALELRATRVFTVPLEHVSVKRRAGGPVEDPEDLALAYWGGVIPLSLDAHPPVPDLEHTPLVPPPPFALTYDRRRAARREKVSP